MSRTGDIGDLAQIVVAEAAGLGVTLATAESCTGGLVGAALTSVPGSSKVFLAGLVTYSNEAKTALLGVPGDLIASDGAVSEAVAIAMAEGARARTGADLAVSITGVAGPGGGSLEKPVGLVHFAVADARGRTTRRRLFGDLGREGVRSAAVVTALQLVSERLRELR
ncbi:MAG: CinA family protein [Caulobacteraceae bacterium]